MEIRYYKKNDEIKTYEDWERVFRSAKPKDWEEGRSAQSLAFYMMKNDGFEKLKQQVGEALNEQIVEIEKATIEGRVAFDNYNHSREHDLAIMAKTKSGKSVFVGIEAKVDESFGSGTIHQYQTNAVKKNINSKVPERVKLLRMYFPKNLSEDCFNSLQYQLATATAGTLCAKTDDNKDFDMYVFMVLVFKTEKYDAKKGQKNKIAFDKYIQALQEQQGTNKYVCKVKGKQFAIVYVSMDLKAQ